MERWYHRRPWYPRLPVSPATLPSASKIYPSARSTSCWNSPKITINTFCRPTFNGFVRVWRIAFIRKHVSIRYLSRTFSLNRIHRIPDGRTCSLSSTIIHVLRHRSILRFLARKATTLLDELKRIGFAARCRVVVRCFTGKWQGV